MQVAHVLCLLCLKQAEQFPEIIPKRPVFYRSRRRSNLPSHADLAPPKRYVKAGATATERKYLQPAVKLPLRLPQSGAAGKPVRQKDYAQ
jgi:hypothetical protein